jgi:uncharacterized protein YjbI with pentapeptide repeats
VQRKTVSAIGSVQGWTPWRTKIISLGLEWRFIAWNEWRHDNPNIHPDLSGTNLSGVRFEPGIELSHANLSGANLCKAQLNGAVLMQANLREASLESAGLGRGA